MATALCRRATQSDAPPATTASPVDADGDPDLPIEEVWRRYSRSRSAPLRERLIVHYMRSHVRPIAERLRAQLPRQVEVDDLVQTGYLGLVDAIERYDISRDVRFETFSARRICGSMQDYLREIDPVPRLMRSRSKKLAGELERFHAEHGRAPDDQELRERLDLPEKHFQRVLAARQPASMVSFNAANSDSDAGDDADAMDSFEDRDRPDPLSQAERDDLKRWVTTGFARRDRLIIILYYFERMTMKDVGRTIGCSESRVSQRLDAIMECLRSRLVNTGAEQEFFAK